MIPDLQFTQLNCLTMLAITCINSIVHNTVLIKFVISDFELNIVEPAHSAMSKTEKGHHYCYIIYANIKYSWVNACDL